MTVYASDAIGVRAPSATASGLIVHEWVERWGGAERVLDAMTDAFPDARRAGAVERHLRL